MRMGGRYVHTSLLPSTLFALLMQRSNLRDMNEKNNRGKDAIHPACPYRECGEAHVLFGVNNLRNSRFKPAIAISSAFKQSKMQNIRAGGRRYVNFPRFSHRTERDGHEGKEEEENKKKWEKNKKETGPPYRLAALQSEDDSSGVWVHVKQRSAYTKRLHGQAQVSAGKKLETWNSAHWQVCFAHCHLFSTRS